MPTAGYRNNNPGNLKRETNSLPYKGEMVPTTDPPWRQFSDIQYGYRAMFHLLMIRYIMDYGLNTIEKMITRYAPPHENDTNAYINFVSVRTGIGRHETINHNNKTAILNIGRAISRFENGIEPVESDLLAGWSMLLQDIEDDVEGLMDEGRNPKDRRNSLLILAAGALMVGFYFIGRNIGKKI